MVVLLVVWLIRVSSCCSEFVIMSLQERGSSPGLLGIFGCRSKPFKPGGFFLTLVVVFGVGVRVCVFVWWWWALGMCVVFGGGGCVCVVVGVCVWCVVFGGGGCVCGVWW